MRRLFSNQMIPGRPPKSPLAKSSWLLDFLYVRENEKESTLIIRDSVRT